MGGYTIHVLIVAVFATIFLNLKNNERVNVCLYWCLILLVGRFIEQMIGRPIAEFGLTVVVGEPGYTNYLSMIAVYYITMALINLSLAFFIILSVNSEYRLLQYVIVSIFVIDLIIPAELIINSMIYLGQMSDVPRNTFRAYKEIAPIIHWIEILLLVVDNHGVRNRVLSILTSLGNVRITKYLPSGHTSLYCDYRYPDLRQRQSKNGA